jgi:CDGSH-type Zn-finger protein
MKIAVEKGRTYFLCSCEKSTRYPLCDGSHRGTEKKSIPYVALETREIIFEKGKIVDSNV